MFGRHRKQRSLISIRELERSEKAGLLVQDEDDYSTIELETSGHVEPQTPQHTRNLPMIYLLFLAEAIMASSLSAQIAVLVPSTATGCAVPDAAFLRSIFQCAYYIGSTAGVFWGWTADRLGRRRVVMIGLAGMAVCCVSMGFATKFLAFAVLRFVAGLISSAVTVAGMAMLADVTQGSKGRVNAVAKLPLVAFCGSLGPLAANSVRQLSEKHGLEAFAKYPGLSGQLACASLVGMIAVAEALLLEETLQLPGSESDGHDDVDCEKAAFLGQSLANDSDDSLTISMIEALNAGPPAATPCRMTISQLLAAPSLLVLLASYSVLALHTSTFDVLLPHISHTASHAGGMGIPCSWLGTLKLMISFIAGVHILKRVPHVIERVGLLKMYHHISWIFPALYFLLPLVGLALSTANAPPLLSALTSIHAMLIETHLAGAAQVLVILLVLSAAPDASSTGTVIGVLSFSEIFKALAIGASGLSYYLSDSYSMLVVNGSLWGSLALLAAGGALITRRLRETPRVGADIPETCLVWQGVFDAESDEEAGL